MIQGKVKRLVNLHGTNDPYELADIYDIHVSTAWLPPHIRGFFTLIFGYAYIVLNDCQHNLWKRAVLAHELGHAVLHDHLGCDFITMNTLFPINKFEREANEFAAYLLSYDISPKAGETIEQFAYRVQAPAEILKYGFGEDEYQ